MTTFRFPVLLGGLVLGLGISSTAASSLYAQAPSPVFVPVTPDPVVDRHALAAPREVERSLDALAQYLARPARCDHDKVRAIFRWMIERIRYDVNAHFTNHPGEVRPEVVLREREATAFGYATLFEALARRSGLEAVTIHGHAKMKHHTEEGQLLKVKHAWNAVKADGAWQFVDVTWGSGFLKGQRWRRVVQEQYLLVPPQPMVLTHLPYDPRWQLLPVPMTPQQFDAMPVSDANFFNFYFKHLTEVQRAKTPDGKSNAVHSNTQMMLQTGKVKVLSAPPTRSVPRGADCYFVIEAIDVAQMALWNNGQWLPLRKIGTRFEGGIRPESGEMRLCLQRPQDPTMQTVITYKVGEP